MGEHAVEPSGPTPATASSAEPGAHPGRERQRLLTHQRILAAAASEFERVGVAHARVGHICRAARITRPTFYAHFPTKEDVVLEFQRRAADAIAEAILVRLAEAATLAEVIDSLVDGLFAAAGAASPRLRREILALDVRERRRADWDGTPLFDALCTRLGAARRRGEIDRRFDAAQLTRCILASLLGFLLGGDGDLVAGRADARAMLRILTAGVGGQCGSEA